MQPTDVTVPPELLARATRAYERGRLQWAAKSALPVVLVPLVSLALGGRAGGSMALGAALVAVFGALLWTGRGFATGAKTGLFAGIPALLLAHAAQLSGHVCVGDGCYSLCLPACVAGGLVAGVVVARAARRSPTPGVTVACAAGVSLLTGALGCSCVGYSGVVGLVAGLGTSLGAALLVPRASRA